MFTAVVQASEESVINANRRGKDDDRGRLWTVPALPHDQLQPVLRKHGLLQT